MEQGFLPLLSQNSSTHPNLDNCFQDKDPHGCRQLFVSEVVWGLVLCFLFYLAALIRFLYIRSIGFASSHFVYSLSFQIKRGLSWTMVLSYLALMIVVMSLDVDDNNPSWFMDNEVQYSSLFYLFNVAAWAISSLLSAYEYKKSLSEAIYSHQLFWSLNLLMLIVATCLNYKELGLVNQIFQIFQIAVNFVLVVLMILTKRRTIQKPRPVHHYYEQMAAESSRGTIPTLKKSTYSSHHSQGLEIEVKMGRRFFEQEGVLVFEFSIRVKEKGVDYKVQKTYDQFLEIDEFLKSEFTPAKYPLVISDKDQIPTLQKDYLAIQTPRTMKTEKKSSSSLLSFQGASAHTDKLFLNWVENLERFMKEILSKKLYHCRQILEFCKIPAELQSQLLQERSNFIEARNPSLKVSSSFDNERSSSYFSKDPSMEINQIDEESDEEEEKVQHKKPRRIKTTSDFEILEGSPLQGNIGEDCSLGKIPFQVRCLKWQLSNQGDYKEFVLQVEYKEGDGASWKICKRYRQFAEFHEQLQEYAARKQKLGPAMRVPRLPPKIASEDEEALGKRGKELERYLQTVINQGDFPQILLQFLEFIDNSQSQPRVTEYDSFSLSEYQDKRVRSVQTKLKIVNQKPKTYYVFEIALTSRKTNKSLANRVSHAKNSLLQRFSSNSAQNSSSQQQQQQADPSNPQQQLKFQHTYKDFRVLNHTLFETFKEDMEVLVKIPNLPQKKTEMGSELPTQVVLVKLENYLNEVISNRHLEKLLCLQQFLWDGHLDFLSPEGGDSAYRSPHQPNGKLTSSSKTINESQPNMSYDPPNNFELQDDMELENDDQDPFKKPF